MFENLAAIDIGTSSIKVVTVRTGFKDFKVKSFTIENRDYDIENTNEAISNAIERVMAEENLKDYKIVTNLPMEKAIIRNISFPFSDVSKISEAIPYEAEENIPFKLDNLILDFQTLKSGKKDEGNILLTASHKESIYEIVKILNENKLQPVVMGMESNSLYECYKYFNKIENETVIQIDIGNNKTIANIIQENHLLYTRSISNGISQIHRSISEILKISLAESVRLFESLNIDLTSINNNYKRGYYKSLGLNKQKFNKIFNFATEHIDNLVEQIVLTVKAYFDTNEDIEFNRILISGGGANISGIGHLISQQIEIPVVALPFLEDYKEKKIQTHFPVAFGMILSYLNHRKPLINFLKGEFIPDVVRTSKKIYYLAGGFIVLSIIVLIINLISSSIMISKSNSEYNKIISIKIKKLFPVKNVSDNPISDARKLYNKEKKELADMSLLIDKGNSMLGLIKEITSSFVNDENFNLKNITINKRVVSIRGTIGTSKKIDNFKENLEKSNKYDSVSLNIRSSRKRSGTN
ncbi:pilus assembly protein PilM, partial [Spirochaetota bacterium]